jgi:hypothetical protein
MITVFGAILIAILSAAVSALLVAFYYEKSMKRDAEDRAANLENDYRCVSAEYFEAKLAIAKNDGISIGRQCDALQQQMIKSLNNDGHVSVRTGGRHQAGA